MNANKWRVKDDVAFEEWISLLVATLKYGCSLYKLIKSIRRIMMVSRAIWKGMRKHRENCCRDEINSRRVNLCLQYGERKTRAMKQTFAVDSIFRETPRNSVGKSSVTLWYCGASSEILFMARSRNRCLGVCMRVYGGLACTCNYSAVH